MYDFRMPDDETNGQKRYPIYWDYNFGLVRMTNIYKACGLPKVKRLYTGLATRLTRILGCPKKGIANESWVDRH